MRWLTIILGLATVAAGIWLMRRFDARVNDKRIGAADRSPRPALAYFAGILLLMAGVWAAVFAWFVR